MIKVSVIIPYYQRQPGILRRALTSVLEQDVPEDIQVEVIVVDDGSPAPAQPETEGLNFLPPHSLTVIKEHNGGAGAARNTGLQCVSRDTSYIAFLDSDDIWHPRHLAQAIATLEQGYDYYFCDCRRIGNLQTFFEERNFSQFLEAANAEQIGDSLYSVDKELFFHYTLRSRASMIPAIVYRRSIAHDLRFDSSLRFAGEDCLFLFQLLTHVRAVACSTEELVTCAEGINLYASQASWDNPGHLIRQMCGLLALYKFREKLRLTHRDNNFFARRIKKAKQIFAFLTVRHFIKFHERWPQELIRMIRRDRRFWFWYPLYVLYVSICFPLRLYDPLDDFWCTEREVFP